MNSTAQRDWEKARKSLDDLPLTSVQPLWKETTCANLQIQRQAFAAADVAVRELDQIIARVKP